MDENKKLDKLLEVQQATREDVILIKERMNNNLLKTQRNQAILFGDALNNVPGLIEKVKDLEEFEKKRGKRWAAHLTFVWAVLIALTIESAKGLWKMLIGWFPPHPVIFFLIGSSILNHCAPNVWRIIDGDSSSGHVEYYGIDCVWRF